MVATRQLVPRVLPQSQASSYICGSCRHHLPQAGISFQQQRFASSASQSAIPLQTIWTIPRATGPRDRRGPLVSFTERYFHSQPARQAKKNTTKKDRKDAARPSESHVPESNIISTTSKAANQEYVPAETWDGLAFVGSKGKWQEMPVQPGDHFTTWHNITGAVAIDRTQLVSCLHQALVECLTCTHAGIDSTSTHHIDFAQLDQDIINAIAAATIIPSSNGRSVEVQFASETDAKAVVALLAAMDSALNHSEPEPVQETITGTETEVNAEADTKSNELQPQEPIIHTGQSSRPRYIVRDESFLQSSLVVEDSITFDVLKRFSQLSGHHIPDPLLNNMLSSNKPLSFLVERIDQLILRPRPKELAQTLINKPGLGDLPNVLIFPRRETPVDKEKEIGRWKIIEQNLKDHNLPVLGKLKA